MRVQPEAETKVYLLREKIYFFRMIWNMFCRSEKDGAVTADTPPRDRRRVKGLCVENECFVLFIIAIVLSVG